MNSHPKNLLGVYRFEGEGLDRPRLLDPGLVYIVPGDRRAQAIYLRAGNSSGELACISVLRGGEPFRLFPVGARAAIHVPLAVLEDLEPDTRIDVLVAAPLGAQGEMVIDFGLMEI